MNLEHQKQNFKNHIATLTDLGNIKILDFADPNSSHYRIRFLFEEDYCRLHISGDLGELVATNYYNMRFEKFTDFTRNTGYFREKINCHSRPLDIYDYDLAEQELRERIIKERWLEDPEFGDLGYFEEDEEARIEEGIGHILRDYDQHGIGSLGYAYLSKFDDDAWEWAYDLGKKDTGILDLYMLAFTLATEQLAQQKNKDEERTESLPEATDIPGVIEYTVEEMKRYISSDIALLSDCELHDIETLTEKIKTDVLGPRQNLSM